MPGVKVVEEENVPETIAVQKTMERMINLDGATLIFPTSFGYFDPHMLKWRPRYPNVQFAHCGGLWTAGKHPDEHRQLLRLYRRVRSTSTASSPAITTKIKKLGFVAAKPIPQVLRNINSFLLGAQLGRSDDHDADHLHRRLERCRSRKPRPPTAWSTRASTS